MLSLNYFRTYDLGTVVAYPFTAGPILSGGYVVSTGNTYTINGATFTDVAQVARRVQTDKIFTDTFYINAEAGIVRMVQYQQADTTVTLKVFDLQRRNLLR
jgi:hypothetical protein